MYTTLLPIVSRIGSILLATAGSPPVRMTRVPSLAGFLLPMTGASRKSAPLFRTIAAISREDSGETVLMSM